MNIPIFKKHFISDSLSIPVIPRHGLFQTNHRKGDKMNIPIFKKHFISNQDCKVFTLIELLVA